MKRLIILFVLIILLLFLIVALPAEQPSKKILPDDFSARAFDHIVQLSQLGHRQVGTENDRLTIRYIREQFEHMNVDVEVQPFEFESFEYTELNLLVGDKRFDVVGLGFDPYENKRKYEGMALLTDLNDSVIPYTPEEIEGRTVITNNWKGHFRLLRSTDGCSVTFCCENSPYIADRFGHSRKWIIRIFFMFEGHGAGVFEIDQGFEEFRNIYHSASDLDRASGPGGG